MCLVIEEKKMKAAIFINLEIFLSINKSYCLSCITLEARKTKTNPKNKTKKKKEKEGRIAYHIL